MKNEKLAQEGMEEAVLWTPELFSGQRKRRGSWRAQEWTKQRRQGEKKDPDVTFRALPESVGFHAEGGAETLFIV